MTPSAGRQARWVAHGDDRFAERRGLGISSLYFKVSTQDTDGRLFIIEQVLREKGGPPRHLHHEQEEWFYSIEGEFIAEVDQQRVKLAPGDSLLAPRKVPHAWAYVGHKVGRLLVAFPPAGRMEAFFREMTKTNAMPPQNPDLWRARGMEMVGPPLEVK